MKTIRLFFATVVMLLLAVGISSGQSKKTTQTYSWPYAGPAPCANENIVGEESCVVTIWDGKYQCKYEGTYTGSASGKCYTMSAFEIESYKAGKASNDTYVFKSILKCDGVPIAFGHFKSHVTINANGELTVEREKGGYWEWICL